MPDEPPTPEEIAGPCLQHEFGDRCADRQQTHFVCTNCTRLAQIRAYGEQERSAGNWNQHEQDKQLIRRQALEDAREINPATVGCPLCKRKPGETCSPVVDESVMESFHDDRWVNAIRALMDKP